MNSKNKSNQFNNQIDSLTKDNIEIRRQLEKLKKEKEDLLEKINNQNKSNIDSKSNKDNKSNKDKITQNEILKFKQENEELKLK